MTTDPYLELAPLAALGVLDGEDRTSFEGHLPHCPACQAELRDHKSVAARIPLGLGDAPPSPSVRERVLAAAGKPEPAARPGGALMGWLATAAAIALGVAFLVTRAQRDDARREAQDARGQAAAREAEVRQASDELLTLRPRLAEAEALRDLLAQPESRTVSLAGLAEAPGARGRVVWNPASREAVLLASGLQPAAAGKAYEVWVIAQGAPAPAGVFQVDASGKAVVRLPVIEETARVKTFAVTVEPAVGTPAPTGPMVLAGAVS